MLRTLLSAYDITNAFQRGRFPEIANAAKVKSAGLVTCTIGTVGNTEASACATLAVVHNENASVYPIAPVSQMSNY